MKVIWFNGNLGNQVFYCKYADFLRRKFPQENVYFYSNSKCPKISVEQYFHLSLPQRTNSIITIIVFEILGKLFRRIPLNFVPSWYCTRKWLNHEASYFEHYLQDKSFFENEDSSWLEVKQPIMFTSQYLQFENLICKTISVAIHIRRGDYITPGSDYEDLSSTDYYEQAIIKAKEIYPDAHFFFFSDDLEFVKNRFQGENYHYVDCNRGADSYLDIQLMSHAKVCIIANSTFSYWGAYMNHEKKVVMYPSLWFRNESGRKMPDIMLDSWICIQTKRI